MTKIEVLTLALSALSENAEAVEKLQGMIAQEEKQASRPHTPSARTQENAALRGTILEALKTLDRPVTSAELIAESPTLASYTVARITSILTLMKRDGQVTAETVKRKNYYFPAVAE